MIVTNKDIVSAYFEEVEVELEDGTISKRLCCKGCRTDEEVGHKMYNPKQSNGNQNLANHVKAKHADYFDKVQSIKSGKSKSNIFRRSNIDG